MLRDGDIPPVTPLPRIHIGPEVLRHRLPTVLPGPLLNGREPTAYRHWPLFTEVFARLQDVKIHLAAQVLR
jgi:hypothetical protein